MAELACLNRVGGPLDSSRRPRTNSLAHARRRGWSVWSQHVRTVPPRLRALPLQFDAATLSSVDTAQIVAVLKGPPLSELLVYGRAAAAVAGGAWQSLVSPFAIFGDDKWTLNLLFYAAVMLTGYNLVLKAPKQ